MIRQISKYVCKNFWYFTCMIFNIFVFVFIFSQLVQNWWETRNIFKIKAFKACYIGIFVFNHALKRDTFTISLFLLAPFPHLKIKILLAPTPFCLSSLLQMCFLRHWFGLLKSNSWHYQSNFFLQSSDTFFQCFHFLFSIFIFSGIYYSQLSINFSHDEVIILNDS